jgi:hypothetical protein
LLDQTPVDEETRDRIRTYIATDFSARRTLNDLAKDVGTGAENDLPQ